MPIAYLTRRERFSAAHRLYKQELTDEENFRLFGQCSHPNWHGHNYELFVTIKGEVNHVLGYVVNFNVVSQIIKERIISKLDHTKVNIEVDFMKGVLATTENLAIAIWKELEKPLTYISMVVLPSGSTNK
mgnify:CR=1 FL=1